MPYRNFATLQVFIADSRPDELRRNQYGNKVRLSAVSTVYIQTTVLYRPAPGRRGRGRAHF